MKNNEVKKNIFWESQQVIHGCWRFWNKVEVVKSGRSLSLLSLLPPLSPLNSLSPLSPSLPFLPVSQLPCLPCLPCTLCLPCLPTPLSPLFTRHCRPSATAEREWSHWHSLRTPDAGLTAGQISDCCCWSSAVHCWLGRHLATANCPSHCQHYHWHYHCSVLPQRSAHWLNWDRPRPGLLTSADFWSLTRAASRTLCRS